MEQARYKEETLKKYLLYVVKSMESNTELSETEK